MTDRVTPEIRSQIMKQIPREDTTGGFESSLRYHAGIRRASATFWKHFSIQQPAKAG